MTNKQPSLVDTYMLCTILQNLGKLIGLARDHTVNAKSLRLNDFHQDVMVNQWTVHVLSIKSSCFHVLGLLFGVKLST
jgi:hypothetical protein